MAQRQKLSTTIGPVNYAYLRRLVKAGKATSIGDAVDRAVELARRAEDRAKLAQATAAYFEGLSAKAAAEDAAIETALSDASGETDFGQP